MTAFTPGIPNWLKLVCAPALFCLGFLYGSYLERLVAQVFPPWAGYFLGIAFGFGLAGTRLMLVPVRNNGGAADVRHP